MRRVELKASGEIATFHQWGLDFEELNGGNVTYSVAIIEMSDGKIRLEYAANIRFIDGGIKHE